MNHLGPAAVRPLRLLGALAGLLSPALTFAAAMPEQPHDAASHLADDTQFRSQLDPALDSDEGEEPKEFTAGPQKAPVAAGALPKALGPEDFRSLLSEGALAQAQQAYRNGRYRQARQLLLEREQTLPVRYLLARVASRMGDEKIAAELYSALAAEHPPLRNTFLFEAGRAYERRGLRDMAAEAYAGVTPEAQDYPQARWGLSRLLERRGDLAGAIAALSEVIHPSSPVTHVGLRARAWMSIAQLARKQGAYNGEHRALLAAWALHPFTAEANAAERRLKGVPIPPHWRVSRAETLISMHLNDDGMRMIERVLPKLAALPDETTCRAHFAYGTALRKERKHARAIRVLKPVVAQCRSAELRPRALYVLGYSQSVVERENAPDTYLTLAREYASHNYADDALFFAAELRLRDGDMASALSLLEELIQQHPTGDFTADALFKRFWAHKQARAYAQAQGALDKIESLEGSSATQEQLHRARYWRARLLQEMGRNDESLSLLERVAAEGAATYYGLLARTRLTDESPSRALAVLKKLSDHSTPAHIWPLSPGALANDSRFQTGLALLKLGHPDAGTELLAVQRKGHSEESIRLLFHMLNTSGYPKQARVVARAYLREGLSGPSQAEARLLYEVAFPQAFRGLVEKHSKAAKVDPDLMQALIREESAFNPYARSATGAIGLAQLMPQTAFSVARSLRGPRITERALFDPRQNIRLGSAYLGSLHRRFDGNAAYAVASYNAGPGAVDRWLKRLPETELDAWVEEIPVEETRKYVQRVLGSYATYQLIYEQDLGVSSFALRSGGTGPSAAR